MAARFRGPWVPALQGCRRTKMMTMTILVRKVTQKLRNRFARRCSRQLLLI